MKSPPLLTQPGLIPVSASRFVSTYREQDKKNIEKYFMPSHAVLRFRIIGQGKVVF